MVRFFLAIKPALAFNPHMQNEIKNTVAGINEVIARRIANIQSLVKLGWNLDAAIESVRNSSTLGAKSWQSILKAVGK